ncbi:hypothetical protein MRB53_038731 [Persea americana]|nr:hypothetical protein MRB53_038731 [Persea americana]
MAQHFADGKKLLSESKYTEAITSFTKAISVSATSPDYLIKRSTAYQRAKDYSKALEDAESAVVYAQQRAKRELIIQAQMRRGIALFGLEQYGDAEFVLSIVKRMDEKEKSVDMWLSKTRNKLATVADDDTMKSAVNVKETPELKAVDAAKANGSNGHVVEKIGTVAPQPTQTPADKVRHEWYQNSNSVFFTLLAKGVPKDKTTIDITSNSLTISYPIEQTSSSFDYSLDPLFGPVNPEKSSYKILGTKIEVTLAKETAGHKWSSLEGTPDSTTSKADSSPSTAEKPQATSTAPAYPTSAKGGAKNWDKIVDENSKAGEDDDDVGGDEASKFFKQLYKGASAETQRAMMKSYIESNGTALSTDWGEVSKGKVETVPPDGMQAKKWEK